MDGATNEFSFGVGYGVRMTVCERIFESSFCIMCMYSKHTYTYVQLQRCICVIE